MKIANRFSIFLLIACLPACNQFTYLPKSAKQKHFARPHIQFMMAVTDFREATGVWPTNQFQLENHTRKNRQVIQDFQYETLYFTLKKDDRLEVFFDNYKKTLYLDIPGKTDLNRLHGKINFYKSGDKLAWKVRML